MIPVPKWLDRLLRVPNPNPAPRPGPVPDRAWDRCACGHGRWQHHDGTEHCHRCGCSFLERLDTYWADYNPPRTPAHPETETETA